MKKLKLIGARTWSFCVNLAGLMMFLFALMYLLKGQYDAACAWFLFVAVSQLQDISLSLSKDK